MTVYRVDLSYDGTGFRGYAKQTGQRTVQGDLEMALSTVLGFPVETVVAGRTDAGVHAKGQVVSFEIGMETDVNRLVRSLNGLIGPEVAVVGLTKMPEDFNARFSAIYRRYRYLIDTSSAQDPLTRHVAWHVGRALDLGAMNAVARAIVGEHDFGSFCRSVVGKSNVRRVEEAFWEESEGFCTFWIQANAFCHQMVRSVVGHCYDVGRGFADSADVTAVIESADRSTVATVAPPHGLVLWEVGY